MFYFQDFFVSGERMYEMYNQTTLEDQIMTVSYVVQNLTAAVKRLHIRLKPNNDIVVNMYGFNNAATDKVVSNCGRKPIVVEAEGFELNDLQLGGVSITNPYNYYDDPVTQIWSLENHDITPAANKRIRIKWVEPDKLPLVGPDLYGGIYNWDNQTLKQWVNKIADAGMNYLRLIVPANCWEQTGTVTQARSLFLLKDTNKYNLREYYQAVFNKLINGLGRARERRMTVQIDLMDNVMFHHSTPPSTLDWFEHSEYAGANNTTGYPLSDFINSYYDSLAGGGSADYRSALHSFLPICSTGSATPGTSSATVTNARGWTHRAQCFVRAN